MTKRLRAYLSGIRIGHLKFSRTAKPANRRNKVLFINAVNEVTRERAQSFLTDDHLDRIVKAYQGFADIEGFAKVVDNAEIREKGNNLSIPLYVRSESSGNVINGPEGPEITVKQAIKPWQASSQGLRASMKEPFSTLEQNDIH